MLRMLAAGLIIGCLLANGDAPRRVQQPDVAIEAVNDLGALRFMDMIRGRDGGYSIGYQGQSLWNFGDTIVRRIGTGKTVWRSSTWASTPDLDASDNLYPIIDPLNEKNIPNEFLPFTAAEKAFNKAHRDDADCQDDCGARVALWPAQMLVDPDTGHILVFYDKLIARPGYLNFYSVGWSIAIWDGTADPPLRPEIRPGTDDPTLLFQGDQPYFGTAALLIGTDVYAFACTPEWFVAPCVLAKVPIRDIFDPGAWRYYGEGGRWVADVGDATPILSGHTIMSVYWNAYLNRYIAIYSGVMSDNVYMRVADRLEGPWSDEMLLFETLASEVKLPNYSALGHAELAQERGRIEYVTYFRTGSKRDEMRLVQVIFK